MTPNAGDELLDQLGRGEVAAVGELFAVYESYLRAVVRSRLSDRLRAEFDSVDVVQSVWVQVLRRLGRDGWQVNDANHLRALLTTIARRRLVSRARKCSPATDVERPDPEEWDAVPDDRNDSPGEVAQASDLWARILELVPPNHHPILLLRREGLPLAEIAARTGLHEGSVRRILRKLSRELALLEKPLTPAGTDDSE